MAIDHIPIFTVKTVKAQDGEVDRRFACCNGLDAFLA